MKFPTDHNITEEQMLKLRNWLRKGSLHKMDIMYPDVARKYDALADAIDKFYGIKRETYMGELEKEFWHL